MRACRAHDECYENCEDQPSRSSCDVKFLNDALNECQWTVIRGFSAMGSCTLGALAYYGFVSGGGGDAFRRARSKCPSCW